MISGITPTPAPQAEYPKRYRPAYPHVIQSDKGYFVLHADYLKLRKLAIILRENLQMVADIADQDTSCAVILSPGVRKFVEMALDAAKGVL